VAENRAYPPLFHQEELPGLASDDEVQFHHSKGKKWLSEKSHNQKTKDKICFIFSF